MMMKEIGEAGEVDSGGGGAACYLIPVNGSFLRSLGYFHMIVTVTVNMNAVRVVYVVGERKHDTGIEPLSKPRRWGWCHV